MGVDVGQGWRRAATVGIASLACFYAGACEEPNVACLDYRANAIDVTADEACEDCCRYPTLALQVVSAELQPDTTLVLSSQPLFVRGSDTTQLLAFAFFLSDIALEREDGTLYPLIDTLSYSVGDDSGLFQREVSLIRVASSAGTGYTYGQLLENQRVVAVRARLGLPDELRGVSATRQYRGSVVAPFRDSLLAVRERESLDLAAWRYRRGQDTILQRVVNGDGADVRFAFNESVELEEGFGLSVVVALPVERLTGVPVGELSAETFVTTLLQPARIIEASVERQ